MKATAPVLRPSSRRVSRKRIFASAGWLAAGLLLSGSCLSGVRTNRVGIPWIRVSLARAEGQPDSLRPATPGNDLLREFARRFNALETFEAEFVQTQAWIGADESPPWKGKLYLKRPNLFRIEYREPAGHLQVSDGDTVWTYVPENGEVLATRLDGEDGHGGDPLRWILETGRAEPEVVDATVAGKPARVLSLVPGPGLGVSLVRLWIRPGGLDLAQYEITDSGGNRNLYALSKTRRDPKLGDDLFRFRPPPGVPVVQLGSP